MNSLVGNDPRSWVPRLQDEINRLYGNVTENDCSSATATWIPAVDIHEYADRFVLPDTADSDNVQATGKNGVLAVTIKKQAKSQPRRIQIAG